MKKNCLFAILTFLSLSSMAQQKTFPIYEKVPGLKSSCNKVETIPYNGGVKDVITPTLSVFLPEKPNALRTAVLIFPGGGYSHLAIEKEGFAVARKFNEYGIAAFVLKYRMPLPSCFDNSQFAPLQDAEMAINIIRENASQYNIDFNNVGILGFSAGGHLASSLLTHSDTVLIADKKASLAPTWGVLGYPVIDMSYELGHTGSRNALLGKEASTSQIDYFSSQKQVNTSTPPAFLFLAADDNVVNPLNSILYYQSMLKNKVKGELHIMQNGGHGFGLYNKTTTEDWFALMMAWLRQNKWAE